MLRRIVRKVTEARQQLCQRRLSCAEGGRGHESEEPACKFWVGMADSCSCTGKHRSKRGRFGCRRDAHLRLGVPEVHHERGKHLGCRTRTNAGPAMTSHGAHDGYPKPEMASSTTLGGHNADPTTKRRGGSVLRRLWLARTINDVATEQLSELAKTLRHRTAAQPNRSNGDCVQAKSNRQKPPTGG